MTYSVAVVGATGLVGRKMTELLEKRDFPISELTLFASEKSEGKIIPFRGERLVVRALTPKNAENAGADIALFSAGSDISDKFASLFVKNGATVIDNSSRWRLDLRVPLVVPEVNGKTALTHRGIIANPNCSTIQSVLALCPIRNAYGLKRVVYSTYQSVSGAGYKGLCDLSEGSCRVFRYPIQDNVIPQIDDFCPDGYTKEERKMMDETRKILDQNDLSVTATAVRVPVRYCHGVSITLTTLRPFDIDNIKLLISGYDGLELQDDTKNYIYPMHATATEKESVYVGRIRKDPYEINTLSMYAVSDNLYKGAALNAVQIAELICKYNAVRATETIF